MLEYAMGWYDENHEPYEKMTGKRLRPSLLLLINEVLGGSWEDALPAATAVELLHNFSLIHDDIQDASEMRHNRLTVWKHWGIPNAINAGDAMFTLAYKALSLLQGSVKDETLISIWKIFNQTNIELTRGQHLDMRFETLAVVEVDDYISMIKGKSAFLLATCAQIGALIAGKEESVSQHLHDFGIAIGIAFQIRDDILGIWGDTHHIGKSTDSDILTKKKSLPILYALKRSNTLRDLYDKESLDETDVAEVVDILNDLDIKEQTETLEKHYYEEALIALEQSKLDPAASQKIMQFVDMLFDRSY
ncbi:polyprenyl synthetase family protein [Anaerolineales bacterium]